MFGIGGALVIGTIAIVVSRCTADKDSTTNEAVTSVPVEPAPSAQAEPAPPSIDAQTPKLRAVAQAVIDWCGLNGKAALWRGDFSVEVVDIGRNQANAIVDHKRKEELLRGNVLWYLVTMRKGVAYAVTPQKQISADACRGLVQSPLEPDVEYRIE